MAPRRFDKRAILRLTFGGKGFHEFIGLVKSLSAADDLSTDREQRLYKGKVLPYGFVFILLEGLCGL